MLIDWFTVVAQALNFLVLMFLLRRFLYRPVLNAIDAREAHIVETVKTAEEQKAEAARERELFAKKNADLDGERAQLLDQARADARAAGDTLLERERQAVEASREKWHNALADEQKRFGDEAVGRIREEVFATVRQVFSDLADESLEDRMAETFAGRLRTELKNPDGKLTGALRAASAPVRVKSAFDLPEPRREELRRTLAEAGAGAGVEFATEPNLVGGVELTVGGWKAVWTIDDYLDRLRRGISPPSDAPLPAPNEESA